MMGSDRARRRSTVAVAVCAAATALLSACTAVSGVTGPSSLNVVSYAGAANALTALDPLEADAQIRDWARLGVASALRLTSEQISDALYETVPLRDTATAGLAEQPTGPGRALFDGQVLHLLLDAADPHRARTLAMLLDQHRADAGADAAQTQLHSFRVDPQAQTVRIENGPVAPTPEVRAGNGWVERRVDDPAGLADFLDVADRLSGLEMRGAELVATGWDLPDVRGSVTVDDVATLDAAYRDGSLPGFSLDPAPVTSVEDVRALIPGLAPELAAAAFSGAFPAGGFGSAAELVELVEQTLFWNDPPLETLAARGLPADRTQLWALLSLLTGRPAYSQSRYEGGLAGTEVGMTLFYTDLVAKDWVAGVGTGVPTDAVRGFVPDPLAHTPPSLCPSDTAPRQQSGRLWFGQSDDAFGYAQDRVTIGARSTRLYFQSTEPGGNETEPDYQFGRALNWWDAHFQAVADYEPEYQRLDDLMRWSGALEWLSATGKRALPAVAQAAPEQRFADWYQRNSDLRERGPIAFVSPPSASQEAVLPVPSASAEDCGLWRISGGVSLADGLARRGGVPAPPDVPPTLRRAWPADAANTRVDPATGGHLQRVAPGDEGQQIRYTIGRGPATSEIEGPPSGAVRIGDDRLIVDSEPRRVEVSTRSDGSAYTFDLHVQGERMGGVEVRSTGSTDVTTTEITLVPGIRESLRAFLGGLRRGTPVAEAPGVRYPLPDGVYRVGDDRVGTWIATGDVPPASLSVDLAIAVAGPDGRTTTASIGAPRRLDVASFPVEQGPTRITYGELEATLPASTRMYLRDPTLGAESPTVLAGSIPADAQVVFTVVRVPASPPVGSGDLLTLIERGRRSGNDSGSDQDRTGSETGSETGSGGGLAGSGIGRQLLPGPWAGGEIAVVTVCDDDQEPRPEECA